MGVSFDENLLRALRYVKEIYFENYAYVYNTFVSFFNEKPVKPLIEIEAAFSHLMHSIAFSEKESTKKAEENLRRFEAHIERMLLDLYKLCFVKFLSRAEWMLESDPNKKEFAEFALFVTEKFYEARKLEFDNIGTEKRKVLDKFHRSLEEVVKRYKDLVARLNEKN